MKRPIDNREMRALKRFIDEKLGVTPRIRTVSLKHYQGLYYPDLDLILLDANLKKGVYIHTLFHEAMHAYCCANDIFKAYHTINEEDATPEQLANWFRTGIRAEMYIDARAMELMKEYNPKLQAPLKTKKEWQAIFRMYRQELEEKKAKT